MVVTPSKKKIGAIIQARSSSTRLPNKIFLSLPYKSNISVLEHIINRSKKVHLLDEIIVATTYKKDDDVIENFCNKIGINCFRGDEDNVLSRFYAAAENNKIDIIIRLTADNPCIDYNLINSTIRFHINESNDYTFTKDYPVGLNIEVCSFIALKKAYQNVTEIYEKEHVTPYIYKSHPEYFKIGMVNSGEPLRRPDIRITLDTEEDYILLCTVYDYLYYKNNFFLSEDIVKLFVEKPWIGMINKKIIQKKIFNTLEEEIEESIKILDLQDLKRVKVYLVNKLKNGL